MRPLGNGAAPVIAVRVDSFLYDQVKFLACLNKVSVSAFVRIALGEYFVDMHNAEQSWCPSEGGHELVPNDLNPKRGETVQCVNDLDTDGRSICGYGFVWDEGGALSEFNSTYDEKS